MFVGVLLTGFGGDWITKGSCYMCGSPHDTARCSRCQCGICEDHGVLLAKAGQATGSADSAWQGASLACCQGTIACEDRQRQILQFWEKKTGETVQ
jgi:hypothetical protein